MSNISIGKRFWSKVNVRMPEECWEWQAGLVRGYGRFRIGQIPIPAHRLSWMILRGPIPEGMLVLHKCDNTKCVNPSHLYLGSHADNVSDRCARYKGMIGRGSRFNGEDIQRIKLLYSKGVTQRKIAQELNVSQPYISLIIHDNRGENARYL